MDTTKLMKAGLLAVLTLTMASQVAAQDFNTRSWSDYSRGYGANNSGRMVNPAYTAPANFNNRATSYRVERDPRYMGALAAKAPPAYTRYSGYSGYSAPSYANYASTNSGLGYASSSVTRYRAPGCPYGGCHANGGGAIYRGQSPAAYPPAAYAPALQNPRNPYAAPGGYGRPAPRPVSKYETPKGYYRGDGIFGKDTVYAENQPVRNFFRFVMP